MSKAAPILITTIILAAIVAAGLGVTVSNSLTNPPAISGPDEGSNWFTSVIAPLRWAAGLLQSIFGLATFSADIPSPWNIVVTLIIWLGFLTVYVLLRRG